MRKLVAVMMMIGMVAIAWPGEAEAQRPDGLGVGLGYGTGVSGVSLKSHQGDNALQGVIGCWGYNCAGIGVSGDYLFSMSTLADEGSVRVAWNLGFGAAAGIWPGSSWSNRPGRWGDRSGNLWLAGQFVAGLEFIFPEIPIDVVLEWRPSLRVMPAAGFRFDHAGFHVRYYF